MVAYSMGCKLAAHSWKESYARVRAEDILVFAAADCEQAQFCSLISCFASQQHRVVLLTSQKDQALKLARKQFHRLDRAGLSDNSVCSHPSIVTIDCSEASAQDLIPEQGRLSLLGGLWAGHDYILRMGFVSRYLEYLLTTSELEDRELCPGAHIIRTWRDVQTCNNDLDCPTRVLIHSVNIL